MQSRRREQLRRPARGPRFGWILIGGALPALALVVLLLSGEDGWRRVREVFPEGAGDRALRAGVAFLGLAALAWGVLPVGFHLRRGTRIARTWFATRRMPTRLFLAPVEGLNLLAVPFAQALYVLAAVALILAFLASLLAFFWILWPEFLGGYEAFRQAGLDFLAGIGVH